MGLPLPQPPSTPTGGSSVRDTTGLIWVRKVFNCFLSLQYIDRLAHSGLLTELPKTHLDTWTYFRPSCYLHLVGRSPSEHVDEQIFYCLYLFHYLLFYTSFEIFFSTITFFVFAFRSFLQILNFNLSCAYVFERAFSMALMLYCNS